MIGKDAGCSFKRIEKLYLFESANSYRFESVYFQQGNASLMREYLAAFLEQTRHLLDGIEITFNGKTILLRFFPTCCSADSVFRPIIQNRVQFNGKYGCSYCYQEGVYLANSMRHLFLKNAAELRTHELHLSDIELTKQYQSTIKTRGVKGPSPLT